MKVGDFNNDCFIDLVIINKELDNIFILLGNGNGIFESFILFDVSDVLGGVVVVDLNKDGFDDIVVGYNSLNNVLVFLGKGKVKFVLFIDFFIGGVNVRDL